MIDLVDIRAAAEVIASEAVVTPILRSDEIDAMLGCSIVAKDESRQRTGSFKFRGAFNRLSAIPPSDRERGVVAVSSGNHGAAVACAAQILGMSATVHIPADAAPAKRALIEQFGARIVTFDRNVADREVGARLQVAETGATFVHPFEDLIVMCGQGTAALELHDQAGALDALVVPMSGGGLMAGCASVFRQLDTDCEVFGVEPALADDTRRSFAAGHPVRIDPPTTIADGLAAMSPGTTTFAINRDLVADILTVTEDELVEAMRVADTLLESRLEPSGAASLAALLTHRELFHGRRVGLIMSGGNIDPDRFDSLVSATRNA